MKTILLFVLILSTFYLQAQNYKELANSYLDKRGELAFTFTATTIDEVKQLSKILSFDHGQDHSNPLTIKAIANKNNFDTFLTFNRPFTVDKKLNDPKEVVMFNPEIHKKGVSEKNAAYTLTFPLEAYPTYDQYVTQMNEFVADHPAIAELVDIGGTDGTSVVNPRLLFIKLSDNVATREKEPRVMYTSSMHGDEIAGYPAMLNLIDYFITAYEDEGHIDHTRIKNLLDNSEVWINPMANPDGTFYGSSTYTSVSGSRRFNDNGVDLNRNYPPPGQTTPSQGGTFQVETQNFMALAESTHFVLAANFHGGEEVVNYPWDYTTDRHPDDTWWQLISTEYAANAQNDSPVDYIDTYNEGSPTPNSGYMDFDNGLNSFPGITHGADWYLIDGGRQDYMNYDMHAKELTIELSSTKTPPTTVTSSTDEIIDFWNYNKEAYIDFLMQGTYGFKGIVKDASGTPMNAKITLIEGGVVHDALGSWVETELPLGDFYRPINAGSYDILIEAIDDCYIPVTLEDQPISDYTMIDLGVITLNSVIDAGPNSLIASNITSNSSTLGWSDINGAISYEINYREFGGTWSQTTSVTNSLNLSSLSPNTTYEFRVNVTCNSNTSPESALHSFTTLAPSYCPSKGDTSSKGITNVTFVGETTIDNSDATNTNGYEDFSDSVLSADVNIGNTTYSLSVKASSGTTGNDPLYTRAFIDFNGDGDFNDSEESIDLGTIPKQKDQLTSLSPVSISIPSYSSVGLVRMRISTRKEQYPTSCEDFSSTPGEIEDYSINIIDTSLGIQDELLSTFNLYPNPVTNGEITLRMPSEITDFKVAISNVLGQQLFTENVQFISRNSHIVKTEGLKTGIYFVTVSTNLGRATKKLVIQ